MRDRLRRCALAAGRVLDRAEEVILVALLGLIVVVSFVDVVVRNVGAPLSRVQQILPNVFVWLVWIGVPFGIRHAEHFRVRILPTRLRARAARPLASFDAGVAVLFFCLTASFGLVAVALDVRYGSTTPIGFPAALLDAAVPIGSVLAIVRLLQGAFGGGERARGMPEEGGDDPARRTDAAGGQGGAR